MNREYESEEGVALRIIALVYNHASDVEIVS